MGDDDSGSEVELEDVQQNAHDLMHWLIYDVRRAHTNRQLFVWLVFIIILAIQLVYSGQVGIRNMSEHYYRTDSVLGKLNWDTFEGIESRDAFWEYLAGVDGSLIESIFPKRGNGYDIDSGSDPNIKIGFLLLRQWRVGKEQCTSTVTGDDRRSSQTHFALAWLLQHNGLETNHPIISSRPELSVVSPGLRRFFPQKCSKWYDAKRVTGAPFCGRGQCKDDGGEDACDSCVGVNTPPGILNRPPWRSTGASRTILGGSKANDITSIRLSGVFFDYNEIKDAYPVYVLINQTRHSATRELHVLRDSGWIDFDTRAVTVEVISFNAIQKSYLFSVFLVEMDPNQVVGTSKHIREFYPWSDPHIPDLVMDCVLLVILLGDAGYSLYIHKINLRLEKETRQYTIVEKFQRLFRVWGILQTVTHVFFAMFYIRRGALWRQRILIESTRDTYYDDAEASFGGLWSSGSGLNLTQEEAEERFMWQRLLTMGELSYTGDGWLAMANALAWVRLFGLVKYDERLSILSATVSASGPELMSLLLLLGWIILGYGMSGVYLFGNDYSGFRSLVPALKTLFFMGTSGEVDDWDQKSVRYSNISPFYHISFIFLFLIIFLNMIIAIITGHFAMQQALVQQDKTWSPAAVWHKIKAAVFLKLSWMYRKTYEKASHKIDTMLGGGALEEEGKEKMKQLSLPTHDSVSLRKHAIYALRSVERGIPQRGLPFTAQTFGLRETLPPTTGFMDGTVPFERLAPGMKMRLYPSGVRAREPYTATVLWKGAGRAMLRWDEPNYGGPPNLVDGKRFPREREESTAWWNGPSGAQAFLVQTGADCGHVEWRNSEHKRRNAKQRSFRLRTWDNMRECFGKAKDLRHDGLGDQSIPIDFAATIRFSQSWKYGMQLCCAIIADEGKNQHIQISPKRRSRRGGGLDSVPRIVHSIEYRERGAENLSPFFPADLRITVECETTGAEKKVVDTSKKVQMGDEALGAKQAAKWSQVEQKGADAEEKVVGKDDDGLETIQWRIELPHDGRTLLLSQLRLLANRANVPNNIRSKVLRAGKAVDLTQVKLTRGQFRRFLNEVAYQMPNGGADAPRPHRKDVDPDDGSSDDEKPRCDVITGEISMRMFEQANRSIQCKSDFFKLGDVERETIKEEMGPIQKLPKRFQPIRHTHNELENMFEKSGYMVSEDDHDHIRNHASEWQDAVQNASVWHDKVEQQLGPPGAPAGLKEKVARIQDIQEYMNRVNCNWSNIQSAYTKSDSIQTQYKKLSADMEKAADRFLGRTEMICREVVKGDEYRIPTHRIKESDPTLHVNRPGKGVVDRVQTFSYTRRAGDEDDCPPTITLADFSLNPAGDPHKAEALVRDYKLAHETGSRVPTDKAEAADIKVGDLVLTHDTHEPRWDGLLVRVKEVRGGASGMSKGRVKHQKTKYMLQLPDLDATEGEGDYVLPRNMIVPVSRREPQDVITRDADFMQMLWQSVGLANPPAFTKERERRTRFGARRRRDDEDPQAKHRADQLGNIKPEPRGADDENRIKWLGGNMFALWDMRNNRWRIPDIKGHLASTHLLPCLAAAIVIKILYDALELQLGGREEDGEPNQNQSKISILIDNSSIKLHDALKDVEERWEAELQRRADEAAERERQRQLQMLKDEEERLRYISLAEKRAEEAKAAKDRAQAAGFMATLQRGKQQLQQAMKQKLDGKGDG